MTDLERDLSRRRLAAPSTNLDRRVEDALDAARRTVNEAGLRKRQWQPLALAFAAVGVVAFLLVAGSQRPTIAPSPMSVVRIEPEGRFREMLLGRHSPGDGVQDAVAHVESP